MFTEVLSKQLALTKAIQTAYIEALESGNREEAATFAHHLSLLCQGYNQLTAGMEPGYISAPSAAQRQQPKGVRVESADATTAPPKTAPVQPSSYRWEDGRKPEYYERDDAWEG